jgi:hypothetical protein
MTMTITAPMTLTFAQNVAITRFKFKMAIGFVPVATCGFIRKQEVVMQLDAEKILDALDHFNKKENRLALIDEAIAQVREDIAGPFGSNNATCGDMALLVAEFNKMRGYTVSQQRPAEIEEGRKDKE